MLGVCTGAKHMQGWRLTFAAMIAPSSGIHLQAYAEFVLILSTGNKTHDIWLYTCAGLSSSNQDKLSL